MECSPFRLGCILLLRNGKEMLFMQEEKKNTEPLSIFMPEIYPEMKVAKITFWIHEEDETNIIEPGDQLLRVETERAFFDVSVPPWITTKCRVKALHKKGGEEVVPGDLLISVEPLELDGGC
jgi:pyruvate/2-oxoglutarate dehydrogenase complex dihydrolipoamide acyltransferase (E2) component